MKYEVINYEVWGNKRDGYEVNDAYNTGMIVEIGENDTDSDIAGKLYKVGFLDKRLRAIEVDGESDYSLYVNYTGSRMGGLYPLCELRRVDDQDTKPDTMLTPFFVRK